MNLDNLTTITQMADFLAGSQAIAFGVASTKDERYCLVERALKRFNYPRLKRDEKGIVIQFLMKLSRYSRQQLTRMIGRFCEKKKLKRYQKTTQGFTQIYKPEDIKLLAHANSSNNCNLLKKVY